VTRAEDQVTVGDRVTLVERRAEALRLDIARAALDLFVQDGDTGATVERIAEAAGVAPRTFYRHFAVKEDVVLPLFQRSSAKIADELRATPDDEPVTEALVRAFRSQLDGERQISARQRDFLGLMMTNPQYRMRWTEVDGQLRSAVADLLASRLNVSEHLFAHQLAVDLVAHAGRRAFEEWLTVRRTESIDTLLRTGFQLVLTGLTSTVDSR
jgi:AcrR family transcriptional regulator